MPTCQSSGNSSKRREEVADGPCSLESAMVKHRRTAGVVIHVCPFARDNFIGCVGTNWPPQSQSCSRFIFSRTCLVKYEIIFAYVYRTMHLCAVDIGC
jgi:hypothetical protein